MQLQKDISLKPFNTFGIDVSAKLFSEIKSVNDIQNIIADDELKQQQKLILGGGSNILFTKNYDGLVIKNSLKGITVVKEDPNFVWVKAAAGEVWHELVRWSIDKNIGGIENLSLIPGLVGAAPMQNIGAYGCEIKDTFESLDCIDIKTGEIISLNTIDCAFGYRESVFKNKYKDRFIITSVTFRLNKVLKFNISYGDIKHTLDEMQVNDITLRNVSDAIIKIRSSKLPDPKVIGNAGSFFKNPVIEKKQFDEIVLKYPLMPSYAAADGVKVPAGWLIEQCGWKGKVVGNTGSHKTQALVLVNYGNATGNEVHQLAMDIKQSVHDKFGIEINTEVNLV